MLHLGLPPAGCLFQLTCIRLLRTRGQTRALALVLNGTKDEGKREEVERQFLNVLSDVENGLTAEERVMQFRHLFMGAKELDLDRPIVQKMTDTLLQVIKNENESGQEVVLAFAQVAYFAKADSDTERQAIEEVRSQLAQLPVEERRATAAQVMHQMAMFAEAPHIISTTPHGAALMREMKAILEGQAMYREEKSEKVESKTPQPDEKPSGPVVTKSIKLLDSDVSRGRSV